MPILSKFDDKPVNVDRKMNFESQEDGCEDSHSPTDTSGLFDISSEVAQLVNRDQNLTRGAEGNPMFFDEKSKQNNSSQCVEDLGDAHNFSKFLGFFLEDEDRQAMSSPLGDLTKTECGKESEEMIEQLEIGITDDYEKIMATDFKRKMFIKPRPEQLTPSSNEDQNVPAQLSRLQQKIMEKKQKLKVEREKHMFNREKMLQLNEEKQNIQILRYYVKGVVDRMSGTLNKNSPWAWDDCPLRKKVDDFFELERKKQGRQQDELNAEVLDFLKLADKIVELRKFIIFGTTIQNQENYLEKERIIITDFYKFLIEGEEIPSSEMREELEKDIEKYFDKMKTSAENIRRLANFTLGRRIKYYEENPTVHEGLAMEMVTDTIKQHFNYPETFKHCMMVILLEGEACKRRDKVTAFWREMVLYFQETECHTSLDF